MTKTRTKKLKNRVNKTIQVCGRKFQVAWGKGNLGGQFHTIHTTTGGGLIVLGDEPKDEYYQLTNLIHEVLEIALTVRGARWRESDERVVFTLDHDKFTEVCLDLTRGLVETGLIAIKEVGDK